MKEKEVRTPEALTFVEMLEFLDEKEFVADLTVALTEVVGGVRATGKQGKLTIKLDVAPRKKGSGGSAIKITPHLKYERPLADRAEEFFFTDEEGRVARDEFRQTLVNFESASGRA